MKTLFVLLLTAGSLLAQGVNAYLSGTILDPTDQAVSDAQVKLTSTRGNQTLLGRSTDAGVFRINGLASGTYSLVIEKEGFKPYRIDALDLVIGQEVTRTVRLELGTRQEAMVVTDSIAEIERVAANGVRGSNYSSREVANIPMIAGGQGRNYRALSYQTPGVGFTSAAHAPFTVNGNRPIGAVNTMVDAAEYNDPVSGNLLGRGLAVPPVPSSTSSPNRAATIGTGPVTTSSRTKPSIRVIPFSPPATPSASTCPASPSAALSRKTVSSSSAATK